MKRRKLLISLTAILLLAAVPVFSLASANVTAGQTNTPGQRPVQCGMMNANCPAAQTNGQCPMTSRTNRQCPMFGQNGFQGRMGMGRRCGNTGILNGANTVNPQN